MSHIWGWECKTLETGKFAFYIVIFEPHKFLDTDTLLKPQNERLNNIIFKDIHVIGQKMGHGYKMTILFYYDI